MPFDQWQAIKAVIGVVFIGGGAWICINSSRQHQAISKLHQLSKQAQKCNLNQRSLRKEKESSRQHTKQMIGRAACIEKVTAHFLDKNNPHVRIIGDQGSDFSKVDCSPFWVVQKNFSKAQYEAYQIRVHKTLVSQQLLIPDQGTIANTNKQVNPEYLPTILTSACTMGIVGTLSLDSTGSNYQIEAKIIGLSLDQIEKYLESEMLYKRCYLVLGGAAIIIGVGIFINMYRDYKKKRLPLEASLLEIR